MVKFWLYPILSASTRSILENTLWKVPILMYCALLSPAIAFILWRISFAALFVKVSARMFHGMMPFSSRYATLYVSTRVFPEPAPAITSDGPSQYSTAALWLSFNSWVISSFR